MSVSKWLTAGALMLLLPTVGAAQEVFKEISSKKLEAILKSMDIDFNKGSDDKDTSWYDFESKKQKLRLWNFSGKDLMLDVVMPKTTLEDINNWNGTAKFSRARLLREKGGDFSILEYNLDLAGGVTEDTIKHFIRRFDMEVAAWLSRPPVKGGAPAVTAASEEVTYKVVAAERLDKILEGLKITYKKTPGKGNNVAYDFDRKGFSIRLTSFGGEDLMVDCHFQAASLEKVNEWNVDRGFVRAVRYPGNGKPFTALEFNLDCAGGVSDSMIRYFITYFDVEVVAFDNFLKGKK